MGPDEHYFQRRDYNATDTPNARGGFGSIHFCTDLTTKQMFAMKHNSKDEDAHIDSIHTEASLLSRLGEHDHVIQMYGAVLDKQEFEFQPPRVYKMMMELAEREFTWGRGGGVIGGSHGVTGVMEGKAWQERGHST